MTINPHPAPRPLKGVLSTTDVDSWRAQRAHFIEAFLPDASLRKVMPVNVQRAEAALAELRDGVAAGCPTSCGLKSGRSGVVNMNEFLLFETMAQLQLSLFGFPTDFMGETNVPLRHAFDRITAATGIGSPDPRFMDLEEMIRVGAYAGDWLGRAIGMSASSVGVAESAGSVPQGPISARLADGPEPLFNAATFVFAGHDTTANTMSWLLFEVAQRPQWQRRLQAEADALFAYVGGRQLDYEDVQTRLPLLGRCLLETLRLWPVVPNGTFRELVADDVCVGPDGRPVDLPKGTFIQIPNWMRHRSTELWGDDAAEWNPERDFTDEETGLGHPMAGFNPSTERFSPFTYGPRDCMGRNFAQMEMRIILAYLLHHFDFELAGPVADPSFDRGQFNGVNRGTMGPQDLSTPPGRAPELALPMRLTQRR